MRGSSSSDAGLCRMRFCRVSQRNHGAQRHQAHVLAAEAHRLAVALAVVEQVPLIAFQHGPRDLQLARRCRAPRTTLERTGCACAACATVFSEKSLTRQRFKYWFSSDSASVWRAAAARVCASWASGDCCARHHLPPLAIA